MQLIINDLEQKIFSTIEIIANQIKNHLTDRHTDIAHRHIDRHMDSQIQGFPSAL